MSKEEVNNDNNKTKISFIKNILLIVVFLGCGVAIGIYGTNKVMEEKDKENVINDGDEWPLEITSKSEYKDQIDELYSIVTGNPIFYSTGGLTFNVMNTNDKLTYIYNNLVANQVGETTTLSSLYLASPTCNYNFLTDPGANEFVVTNVCTVVKIMKSEFNKVAEKLFNVKDLDTNSEFYPADGKKCASENDYYLCGNITPVLNITGALETKFEIIKVTLDKDDTITIYDKGYLTDKRSNVVNPNDGYDNYYLHSSDSKDYYYELKSADNITFKHTFKKNESGKYYFANSVADKE